MPGKEKEERALMFALRVGRCKGEVDKWGHGFVFLQSAIRKRLPINTFVAFPTGQVNEHCLVGGFKDDVISENSKDKVIEEKVEI